ncbi:MAG: ABC-2 transporter permease, partial [Firmicutes bacterium]|nr:ABC-2 transporter permease [Bacillota bacterium]
NIIAISALIVALPLIMDDNFKSDINSGWLNYSYALPIKPTERIAAIFIRRYSTVLVGVLLSICNSAALCSYCAESFGADCIVRHLAVVAAMILMSLPNSIFLLRARSSTEMKKKQTAAGMTMTALIIVMVIVVLKASGVDPSKLSESEKLMEIPTFTSEAFAWVVPLLILMIAASFYTSYCSLRSAYPNHVKPMSKDDEISVQTAASAENSGTVGLLYKELKQNKAVLIFAAVTPLLLTAFPFCFSAIDAIMGNVGADEVFETATNIFVRMLMYAVGVFIVCALMSEVFKGDDKNLWAYFIASAPCGVKGFLYNKYVITLLVNIIYMVSGVFADNLLATVNYFVTGKELTMGASSLYVSGVFLLMAVSAPDIPFTVRYGSRKGSIIKMIIMLLLYALGTAIFFMLPYDVGAKLVETVLSALSGEAGNVLMLILAVFQYIAIAMFLCSYKISCKVFMKGVNECDK